jgi:hypothetical protein
MLSVVYAECRYAERRGAQGTPKIHFIQPVINFFYDAKSFSITALSITTVSSNPLRIAIKM